MNYEELLESRNGAAMAKETIPFGDMYKKIVDGKYVNAIDLRDDLTESLLFNEALAMECEQNKTLNHKNQLHFTLAKDCGGVYGVNIESGNYRTFERLLDENPAIIARKNFIEDTIADLLNLTSYLHDKGIYHVCFSPNNVFARKNDNAVMLLFHGSAYQNINDQQLLYGDNLDFVAPEFLEDGILDSSADIYSLGKFIEYLYRESEVPFELKAVIKKATNEDPMKRFQTPEEMAHSIKTRQYARKSIVSLAGALIISAIVLGVYFSMIPEREDIEFLPTAPKTAEENLLDDGFDPITELGLVEDTVAERVNAKKMKEYEAKAEQIFRKNFTREANRILSKIYNDESMNSAEKKFAASNQSTMEELVKMQSKLAQDAGLNDSRSQVIASQIIEQVSNQMKKEMNDKKKNEE